MSCPSKTEAPRKRYPFYVTCTDKFMSGWGCARGMTNKLVFCCDSYEEAEQVVRNLETRSEMKRINIATSKPYYGSGYLVQYFTREKEPSWYSKHPPWVRSGGKRCGR